MHISKLIEGTQKSTNLMEYQLQGLIKLKLLNQD